MKKYMLPFLIVFSVWISCSIICLAAEREAVIKPNNDIEQAVVTGWLYQNDAWYFYDRNGIMQTGWICTDTGDWYYLLGSGEMLANTITPDGYTVDASGAWIPDAKTYLGIDFKIDEIAYIDFYNVPIPVAARMKRIVNGGDIEVIYNAINNCIISKESDNYDTLGGIYWINFVKHDGSNIALAMNSAYVSYKSQKYVFSKSLDLETLWDKMKYNEMDVSQDEYSQLLISQ